MQIKDSCCVVTGASGATGAYLRKALTAAGARVIGTRSPTNDSASHEISVDLADPQATQSMVAKLIVDSGPIDIWINVVGGFSMGKTTEATTQKDWENMWSINFLTTLHACKAILPHFKARKRGRIINFGSAAALKGMAMASPYLISKAAVHALTQAISLEVEGDITCNAILPGIIDTPSNREAMPTGDFDSWVSQEQLSGTILELLTSRRNGELIVLA